MNWINDSALVVDYNMIATRYVESIRIVYRIQIVCICVCAILEIPRALKLKSLKLDLIKSQI